MTSGLISSSSKLEEQLQTISNGLKNQKEKALHSNLVSDASFYACLADNNRIRAKFGLEIVSAGKFNGNADNWNQNDENKSILSYNRTDDVFFDAEDGVEDSDDSSGNYSVQNVLIIDEDSDEASRMSSLHALNISTAPQNSSFQHKKEPISSASPHSPTIPLSPFQETMHSVEKPRKNSTNLLARRSTLPAPSASMENISIMGILRNNV